MSQLPLKALVIILLCFSYTAYSQTGPGGVGDDTTNILWLKSGEISSLVDGDDITTWSDVSGNSNDVSQPTTALTPVYKTSILNGFPVVRFEKSNGRLRKTSFTDFPTSAITAIYVNKNAESSEGVLSYASSASDNNFLLFSSNNLQMYRNSPVTSGLSFNDDTWHIANASWQNSGGNMEIWKDGSRDFTGTIASGADITAGGSFAIAGEQDAVDGSYAASQAHFGDFAEVMIFNTYLNQAQQIIVSNYLAAKYDLTISNDRFGYQATHPHAVAGIGRHDVSNTHIAAMSDAILQIDNASALDADNEYLLFGHNNGDVITSWTTTEAPDSGVNIQRLAREWRLDETGDLGTVDFTIDVASFPTLPVDHTMYTLMVDSDGDFSSGASVYEMTLDSGTLYSVTGLNFTDGDYVSIAAVNPKIQHTLTTSTAAESTNASIEVSINFIPKTDKTVDYTTANGTAIEPGDYTAASGLTATILAGTTSINYPITIDDDLDGESSENFTVTLSNPSSGIILGTNTVHTYTIIDNDITRKVYFDIETANGAESTATVTVNLTISAVDAINPTTVDYTITGGTAVGSGDDFTLAAGTATFAAGTTTTSFDITIGEDSLNENNETIIIELSNPTNSNLDNTMPYAGTGFVVYTYTINDNDVVPEIEFTSTTSSGLESVSSVNFQVSLNTLSGVDASATYTVLGTATGSGADYILAAGTVTIIAGNTTGNITASIIDDDEVEFSETIVITLTGGTDADLGTNTVFTYTITDNDTFGYTGPGGVGDSDTNILWLDANEVSSLTDGNDLISWSDVSGNSQDFSESATFSPVYKTNIVNGYPTARFNKTNNRISNASFSGFASTAATAIFVNTNNSESGDAQLSYASSTSLNNDFLIFQSNSANLFIANSAINTGVSFNDNNWHIINTSWQSSNGDLSVWKDGNETYTGTHATGSIITDGGSLSLAGEQDSVNGGYTDGQAHTGDHPEVIMYNVFLNDAQQIIVANYLSAKYDIAISNDIYDQDDFANGDFDHNVAGIGRAADGSFHVDSRGNGIVRIYNPNSIDINDYLFWGRSNKTDYSFAENATYQTRISTDWRVTKQNDIGTVTFEVDLTGIDISGKEACADLRLVVDNDSDFLSPTTTYTLTNTSGDIYQATGVSFTDGDYFTIEYIDQIVVDGAQFYNGSGTSDVPDSSDGCYKLLVKSTADGSLTLTENANVREVEVESGGKLVVSTGIYLEVTNAIANSGDIRMIGTSQLIQIQTGVSLNTGSGNLYIDQQGTNASKFRYNYWSSPVSSGSGTYTIDGVLKDGTTVTSSSSTPLDITFTSGYDGDNSTSPITISNYWLYKYDNAWSQVGDTGTLNVGEGYTMKGPGAVQNYTFKGTPNDGDYSFDVTNGDVFLLGNPYPSALDADAFITYNSITNAFIDGSIYFWEHNGEVSITGDEGHYKSNYQGGYSVRNIGGGVAAVAPSGVDGLGTSSGDIPGQYIAVGQGFFVNAKESGIPALSKIVFNNPMREFQVEDGSNSIFFKGKSSKKSEVITALPSFRLGFEQTNSNGIALTRQLLAVFKEGLTTDYDNGYDSGIYDIHGKDAYWKLSESNESNGTYVIAGLNSYTTDVELPLEVVLDTQGIVSFKELEKTGLTDKAYLYDKLEDIYYGLSNEVSLVLESGIYKDRFFVTFNEGKSLSTGKKDALQSLLVYVNSYKQLYVNTNSRTQVQRIEVYNSLGILQLVYDTLDFDQEEYLLKVSNLSASIYIVRIETDKGIVSKKVLIR